MIRMMIAEICLNNVNSTNKYQKEQTNSLFDEGRFKHKTRRLWYNSNRTA